MSVAVVAAGTTAYAAASAALITSW